MERLIFGEKIMIINTTANTCCALFGKLCSKCISVYEFSFSHQPCEVGDSLTILQMKKLRPKNLSNFHEVHIKLVAKPVFKHSQLGSIVYSTLPCCYDFLLNHNISEPKTVPSRYFSCL